MSSEPGPLWSPSERVERQRTKEQQAPLLRGIAARLEGEYGDLLTLDTLTHYVDESYEEFCARARVLMHVPTFVERFARERLRALAKNRGVVDGHPPEVLFICERNDGVSQMAAALFNDRVGRRGHAMSAGARPAGELLDEVVEVLHEIGIDLSSEFPKPIAPEVEQAADVIVTLDAHDEIPLLDGKQYRAWRLPDRHDDGVEGYRATREELKGRVAGLVASIMPSAADGFEGALEDDLDEIVIHVAGLGTRVVEMIVAVADAITAPGWDATESVIDADESVDVLSREITVRAMEVIAHRRPENRNLGAVLLAAQSADHLERIADGAVDAASTLSSLDSTPVTGVLVELEALARLVATMTEKAVEAFVHQDAELASEVEVLGDQLEVQREQVFEALLEAREAGVGNGSQLKLDRISRRLGRAGEHAVESVHDVVTLVTGAYAAPVE